MYDQVRWRNKHGVRTRRATRGARHDDRPRIREGGAGGRRKRRSSRRRQKDLPRPECPARSTRTVRPSREANWRGHSVCQFGYYPDTTRKLQSFRPDRTVRPISTGVSTRRPNLVRVGLYQFESFAFSFGFWSLQPPL